MAVDSSYVFTGDEDKTARQRRRRIAEALMMQGMDTSPIASPWQGAARMAQSLMGGIELGMEDKRDREMQAASAKQDALFNDTLMKAYGGGGSSPVAAALSEGRPSGQPIKLGGFDPSMGRVFEFEGGLNPRDTNGTPSKFGINAKANPDVNLDTLTREQAAGLYRDRYWNAIGADKMDPRLAHVAFDTAVIAGPGKAQELLQASGGDPEKFLMLRKQFQDSLLARNPEKYGPYAKAWNNRIATLGSDIGARPGGMFAVGSGQPVLQGGDTLEGSQPVQVASADQAQAMRLLQMARTPQQRQMAMELLKQAKEANDPTKALQRRESELRIRKMEDELRAQGATPMTPEQRQQFGVSPNQAAWIDRKGNPHLGPVGTNVNVNTGDKADGKFEEELAKGQAKLFTDMVTEGVNAKAETGQIRILREQLARLPGGFGTGLVALASQYGIKLSPQADAIEAASAIINKLVPGQRLPGSGQMSDRDVELFKSSLPSLMNTPEGNKIILDTMEAMAAYKEKQAEIATSVMDGDMTRKEAMKALRGLPDPLAAVRSVAKELPKPARPTGGNALGSPPKGVTAAEWKAMTDEERALWK